MQRGEFRGLEREFLVKQSLEVRMVALKFDRGCHFNETKEYPYLVNVVAFNDVTLDWVVVSRVRMDKQDGNAYAIAFSKTFQKCKADQILSQEKHSKGLL